MQNFPLVSVICLSYNHEAYVVEALNSVINQTYSNIELLIADDCSSDHSVGVIQDWLQHHPNVYFSANEKNLGNTKTFNQLAKKAKGEFIIDLAADDVLLPNCIEKQVTTFQNSKYENLGIVYGNLIEIDENGNFIRNYYTEEDHPESGNIYKMVIGRTTKICSVSSMVKKSIFEKLGYYDENLAYEDLDLWVRASRVYEFEYIDAFLVKKRELSTSLSAFFTQRNNKKTKRLHESSLVILKKAYDLNQTKDEYKALLGRIQFEFYKFLKSRNYLLLFQLLFLGLKTKYKSV
ncbi:MAG: glycosyltransferase [Flavobacterium sp.]|nr:MAG: glycosyltransferase [Flavobacterium sp.]